MSTAQSLLPPLREGDRLMREEFLRRWEAMPELKHAELIDGIVYMPSPVSTAHGDRHFAVAGWLFHYTASTPGCRAGAESTWLMRRDAPQPDVALRILPEYGGQSREEGLYCADAPELIAEVCQSSASRDLGPKLRLYEAAGVREYLTVLIQEGQIIWRELAGDRYRRIAPQDDGTMRSRMFSGLWLDPAALLTGDAARLLVVLDQGLKTQEHAKFVQGLAEQKRRIAPDRESQ